MVVLGRKTTDPQPPIYGVQGLATPDQEAAEGYREGAWMEAPEGPLGKMAMEGEATEAVLLS